MNNRETSRRGGVGEGKQESLVAEEVRIANEKQVLKSLRRHQEVHWLLL